MQKQEMGFPPVFDENSKVLILGSFPSVKSREIAFYYGNKQNRFWKMLCGFFNEGIPSTTQGKIEFLLEKKIALWDMATECQVQGSSDSSIKNAKIADLSVILQKAKIEVILLNGTLAYNLFTTQYANLSTPYFKMPSTSPANPRYKQDLWWEALRAVF